MKDFAVADIVNIHAEALNANAGRDPSAELMAAHPQHEELAGLFRVAGRLKTALKPVTPRPEFVAHLKQQLAREARTLKEQDPRRQQLVWLTIGIGSLVYSVGLLTMGIRATWWMLGLVALLLGWRKRPALAKARQPVRR